MGKTFVTDQKFPSKGMINWQEIAIFCTCLFCFSTGNSIDLVEENPAVVTSPIMHGIV